MTEDEKRRLKKANDHVLARFKRGENLATVSTEATWFPPRPIIAKNKKDVERLYNIQPKQKPNFPILVTGDDEDATPTC